MLDSASSRRWLVLLLLPAALLAGGCASVPFDHPKTHATFIEQNQDTNLGREAAKLARSHPSDTSGFSLLSRGEEALAARLILIRQAELSLDVQYYFILESLSGRLFMGELLAAADRGVRVRLLLDDISTGGYADGLLALDDHPMIEVRLFNPFSSRRGRCFDFLTDFGRVNRRMHNKSFTADGLVTVVGGRTIGDEYFGARQDFDFMDLDLLGVGPVARAVSEAFDDYWNARATILVALLRPLPIEGQL